MRTCEEIATFSQYSLPKPQGEFGSQRALLLALCKQGCASLAAGAWGAVLLTRCKSEPMKLRCWGFFPPASDPLQLKVFQVLQGTLLPTEILVLEKKCYPLKWQCKQERYRKVTRRRESMYFYY